MPSLKIMTWNVENLFVPAQGTLTVAQFQQRQQNYQSKLQLVANNIIQADPDIIGFQEIGSPRAFQDLQNALQGNYPHSVLSNHPDRRGIRNGFLAKNQLENTRDIVTFPPGPALDIARFDGNDNVVQVTEMGRGAVYARMRKSGQRFHFIVAHLKSKLLTYPRPNGSSFSPRNEEERSQAAGIALHRRTAEAVTLRLFVNTVLVNNDTRPLILLGDFNDVPLAQTSLLLTGPEGSAIGTNGFHREDNGDDARLFNLAPLLPAGRDYSRIHNGVPELLDQIYASVELFPRDVNTNRRQLPMTDSIVDFAGNLPSIGNNPNLRIGDIAPDHAPVVATFSF